MKGLLSTVIILTLAACSLKPATKQSSTTPTIPTGQNGMLFEFKVSKPADTAAIRKSFISRYDALDKNIDVAWSKLQVASLLAFDETNPGQFKCVPGYLISVDEGPPPASDIRPSRYEWSHFFLSDSKGVFKVWNSNSIYETNVDNMNVDVTRAVLNYTLEKGCPILGIQTQLTRLPVLGHKVLNFYIWSESGREFKKVTDDILMLSVDRGGSAQAKIKFVDSGNGMPDIQYNLEGNKANADLGGLPTKENVYQWQTDRYIVVGNK